MLYRFRAALVTTRLRIELKPSMTMASVRVLTLRLQEYMALLAIFRMRPVMAWSSWITCCSWRAEVFGSADNSRTLLATWGMAGRSRVVMMMLCSCSAVSPDMAWTPTGGLSTKVLMPSPGS